MSDPSELYLDCNATLPLLPEVREVLHAALEESLVNPFSAHRAGERSRRRLDRAREQVAALLGAQSDEIVFTSGGTEANQLALFGAVLPRPGGRHLVVSAIEHSSTLAAARQLEQLGAVVTWVAPSLDGVVGVPSLLAAVRPETSVVALMAANNETGVLQPVEALAVALAERRVRLHVDAVQQVGRLPLDLARLPAATVSISAHKLGGPPGVGALYVRRGTSLLPLIAGGRQEQGRRGGTHALLSLIGFGAAAVVHARHVAAGPGSGARDRFEADLRALLPSVTIVGASAARLPNTSAVTFEGEDAANLVGALSRAGLHAASGSACQSGATEPSHVLRAMGLSAAAARATVRFSFGPDHMPADGSRAAALVAQVVRERREPASRL